MVIRFILIIYAILDNKNDIKAILIMILTASIIYVVLTPKKIFLEFINTTTQSIVIFFIHYIEKYRVNVSSEGAILQVEIALIIFLIIYAFYFLLDNLEERKR